MYAHVFHIDQKMKRNLLFVVACLFAAQLFAQGTRPAFGQGGDPQAVKAWEDLRKKIYSKKKYSVSKVKGSPYATEVFLPAVIVFGEGEEKEVYARLDAYSDDIEFKLFNNEESEIFSLYKSSKVSCRLNDETFQYLPFKNGEAFDIGFMALKHKGDRYLFYKRTKKILKEKKKAYNSLSRSFPARFVDVEEFFIGKPGETLEWVMLRKKKVLETLDEKDRQKAKEFVKENKIDLKEQEGVVRLLKFLEAN